MDEAVDGVDDEGDDSQPYPGGRPLPIGQHSQYSLLIGQHDLLFSATWGSVLAIPASE